MNNVTQGLLKWGHQVKVVTVSTKKHTLNLAALPAEYKAKTQIEGVFIDTGIKRKDAFFNLFTRRSYNIERFICSDLSDKLEEVLSFESFDVVLIEGLFVTPYIKLIRKFFKGKVVLRAHNVEFKIWERMSMNATNPIKKNYLRLLAKRLKTFEVKSYKEMDGICAMTEIDGDDIRTLSKGVPVGVFPSGYQMDDLGSLQEKENVEKSLFHIASMDWQPNRDAVDWFLDKVWPLVIAENKQAKIYLAGREMPNRYYERKIRGVEVVGEVPVARDFYASKKIMVVPLLSGSGMRVKIIEGMALGKTIVATSIGAEGINVTPNKNILIADSAVDFSQAILKLLKEEDFCDQVGENAHQLIAKEYNNDAVCARMLEFMKGLPKKLICV